MFRAAGLLAALALLSRGLGLVREIVVRQYLGVTTLEATAFDIASRFPEAIFLIVAGGAIGSAFIPTFAANLSRADEAGSALVAGQIDDAHAAERQPPDDAVATEHDAAEQALVLWGLGHGPDPATGPGRRRA